MIEQLEKPKCPKCRIKMKPAGGIVGLNITTDWVCWECEERIVDINHETIETKQILL